MRINPFNVCEQYLELPDVNFVCKYDTNFTDLQESQRSTVNHYLVLPKY